MSKPDIAAMLSGEANFFIPKDFAVKLSPYDVMVISHYERVSPEKLKPLWRTIVKMQLKREALDE